MEGKYPVLDGDKQVGWAMVTRQGLYYHICCRCKPEGNEVVKLQIKTGETCHHIGVLIPVEGEFGLDMKIPVKRLGDRIGQFEISSGKKDASIRFIPVIPHEPFSHLRMLNVAKLERRGDQIGVVINIP